MNLEHWVLVICLAIFFGIVFNAAPVLLRRAGLPIPKSFRAWKEEFERRAVRVIQTDLEAAEAKVDLAEMMTAGKIPADFDPTVWLTCQVAQGFHKEVLAQAERLGIAPEGCFQRVYGVSIEESASGVAPRSEDVEPVVIDEPKVRRIGDRLVSSRRA